MKNVVACEGQYEEGQGGKEGEKGSEDGREEEVREDLFSDAKRQVIPNGKGQTKILLAFNVNFFFYLSSVYRFSLSLLALPGRISLCLLCHITFHALFFTRLSS